MGRTCGSSEILVSAFTVLSFFYLLISKSYCVSNFAALDCFNNED